MNKQELRDKFFKECTTETPRENEYKKVNLAPHDMFEWFWNNFYNINIEVTDNKTCKDCGGKLEYNWHLEYNTCTVCGNDKHYN